MAAALQMEYEPGVPTAITASFVLHVGGLLFFLYFAHFGPQEPVTVIEGVDLLVEESKPSSVSRKRPPAPSMKDFLKMALPAVPKLRERTPLEIQAPEIKHDLMKIDAEKLADRGRMQQLQNLDALDLGKKRMNLAKVEQPLVERESRTLAALPKLEEVGVRQASHKVIQAAALAEERRDRFGPQGLGVSTQIEKRRGVTQAAPPLEEARSPGKGSALDRLTRMLPEKQEHIRMEPKAMPTERRIPTMDQMGAAPLPKRTERKQLAASKKKAVEIEGPLSARKVTAYSLPKFPAWAKAAGIVEADVAIRFYVSPVGTVLADRMRIERTSGYGRLDRLALEHLKKWRFEPLPMGARNEWGIITFRFLLE